MTLTIGTGPFGDQGEKAFNFEARAPKDHLLYYQRPQTQKTISASSTKKVDLEVDGEAQQRTQTQWS